MIEPIYLICKNKNCLDNQLETIIKKWGFVAPGLEPVNISSKYIPDKVQFSLILRMLHGTAPLDGCTAMKWYMILIVWEMEYKYLFKIICYEKVPFNILAVRISHFFCCIFL